MPFILCIKQIQRNEPKNYSEHNHCIKYYSNHDYILDILNKSILNKSLGICLKVSQYTNFSRACALLEKIEEM